MSVAPAKTSATSMLTTTCCFMNPHAVKRSNMTMVFIVFLLSA